MGKFSESRGYCCLVYPLICVYLFSSPINVSGAESGQNLYLSKCAICHGENGEGVKGKYAKPLHGSLTSAQLAKVIEETMPKEDPGSLKAHESLDIANFMQQNFYSLIAREKNRPARIELSRLTVRQYRNSVMDLVASFRAQTKIDPINGLKGEYFKGRSFNKGELGETKTDTEVNFDFKDGSPAEGKIDPLEYSIRWTGNIFAPFTGYYDLQVESNHAIRLWVNDNNTPLIDAWVKSGNDTKFTGSIFLVSGRNYSLRLEFTKAKQGVNDNKKPKAPQPAFVKLSWKKPFGALEIVPSEYLHPGTSPELFIPSTPFPPDDSSLGWEKGSTISKEWDQATTLAALETSKYLSKKINEFSSSKDGDSNRGDKILSFIEKLGNRAFRRPLETTEKALIKSLIHNAKDPQEGAMIAITWVLKSPNFLYRNDLMESQLPSRLSFAIWDSIPDQQLLELHQQGKLKQPETLKTETERLLADPRAKEKIRSFFHHLLLMDRAGEIAKDPARFPEFNPVLESDLRISLEKSLAEIFWSGSSNFKNLFTDDKTYMNSNIGKFYGLNASPKGIFEKVSWEPEKRSGIITHPYMLSQLSYSSESSPIHRGVFLARGIMGVTLNPPPEAVAPLAPSLHPSLTTRERVIMQTKPAACMTCHNTINSLGFTLENFDAVGKSRLQDNHKPVDTSGFYIARDGKKVNFQGPKDLGNYLANSQDSHRAFVENLFHHLIQQPTRAYGVNTLDNLTAFFEKNDLNMRKLAGEIVRVASNDPNLSKGAQ